MNVNWMKCTTGNWCSFDKLDLSGVSEVGVYIIWHEGNPGRVVYVGQGDVAKRIAQHRNNTEITKYAKLGTLRVTWAAVGSQKDRDGIERYLANTWPPLVGDAYPDVSPISVNSPW